MPGYLEKQYDFSKLRRIGDCIRTLMPVIITLAPTYEFFCRIIPKNNQDSVFFLEIYRKHSMGILVKFLQTTFTRYTFEMEQIKQLERKVENVYVLTSHELKEVSFAFVCVTN